MILFKSFRTSGNDHIFTMVNINFNNEIHKKHENYIILSASCILKETAYMKLINKILSLVLSFSLLTTSVYPLSPNTKVPEITFQATLKEWVLQKFEEVVSGRNTLAAVPGTINILDSVIVPKISEMKQNEVSKNDPHYAFVIIKDKSGKSFLHCFEIYPTENVSKKINQIVVGLPYSSDKFDFSEVINCLKENIENIPQDLIFTVNFFNDAKFKFNEKPSVKSVVSDVVLTIGDSIIKYLSQFFLSTPLFSKPVTEKKEKEDFEKRPLFPGSKHFFHERKNGREWFILKRYLPPEVIKGDDGKLVVLEKGKWEERCFLRAEGSNQKFIPKFPNGFSETPGNIDMLYKLLTRAYPDSNEDPGRENVFIADIEQEV
ncbi:MAG: hypothetical protein ACD_79C00063G0001, partial [uncultured bacterium]